VWVQFGVDSSPEGDEQMQWHEIRERHPSRWLLVEAIAAHSVEGRRVLDDLAVLATYADGTAAMNGYRELHRRDPSASSTSCTPTGRLWT
jgi:hypothetical protein